MSGRIDWNVVTLLRVIGVAIIVVGIILAAFDASAINAGGFGTLGFSSARAHHAPLRTFLRETIDYVWKGGLVLAAAEIADCLGWGARGQESPAVEEQTP